MTRPQWKLATNLEEAAKAFREEQTEAAEHSLETGEEPDQKYMVTIAEWESEVGKLTADEKAELADVTTAATMSLKDSHGDIIGAIKAAYENKRELEVKGVKSVGFGFTFTPRKGPGKDNTETQVWSFNETFATTLYDKDGKIVATFVDMIEIATPNYDGASMPHFSGFPGQGGYNNDENHDEVIDGKTAGTEEAFFARSGNRDP